MKKLLLVLLLVSIIIVSGCIKISSEKIDESILDLKYCEKDRDCMLTDIIKFECCSTCFLESINKRAELEREKWREQNCKGPRDFSEEKWQSCFEYAECSIPPIHFITVCIDNKCEINEKEK